MTTLKQRYCPACRDNTPHSIKGQTRTCQKCRTVTNKTKTPLGWLNEQQPVVKESE